MHNILNTHVPLGTHTSIFAIVYSFNPTDSAFCTSSSLRDCPMLIILRRAEQAAAWSSMMGTLPAAHTTVVISAIDSKEEEGKMTKIINRKQGNKII